MILDMAVGKRIKYFRVKKGMTRRVVAIAAHITEGGLFKIEKGERSPSFETVVAIAKALGVPLTEFVD